MHTSPAVLSLALLQLMEAGQCRSTRQRWSPMSTRQGKQPCSPLRPITDPGRHVGRPGYIVLMIVAWTALFHAIFFKKRTKLQGMTFPNFTKVCARGVFPTLSQAEAEDWLGQARDFPCVPALGAGARDSHRASVCNLSAGITEPDESSLTFRALKVVLCFYVTHLEITPFTGIIAAATAMGQKEPTRSRLAQAS